MAIRCLLCDRLIGSEYVYQIPSLSASQGAGAGLGYPITVCASCNYLFDGTTTGVTQAIRDVVMVSGGSFMELPKDRMIWYLASACEATAAKGSLSAWFQQVTHALSGGDITPV